MFGKVFFRVIKTFWKLKYFTSLMVVFGLYAEVRAQDTLSTVPSLSDTLETLLIEATHHQMTVDEAIGSISYLSASDLTPDKSSSTSFSDIVSEIPGLIAQDRNNLELGERIMMRGMGWRSAFGIRGIQIVQNGIPLTLSDGQTNSTIIEPSSIQQVQAIRGPASGYWGNGSNGVIYLNTQPAADASLINWSNTFGSYGLSKSYLQWNTNIKGRRISGYLSYLSTDGYREHNEMEIIRFGTNVDIYSSEKNLVDVTFAWLTKPVANTPGSLSKEAVFEDRRQARDSFVETDSGEEAYQGQLGVRWRHTSDNFQVDNTAYGIRRLLENRLPFGFITLDRWAGGVRSTSRYYLKENWSISGGGNFSYQYDDRLERNNSNGKAGDSIFLDQLEKVWNIAGFTQSTLLLNKWRFTTSIRYDWLVFSSGDYLLENISTTRSGKRNFSSLNPYFGLQYNTKSIRYFANFGSAFQSPTTTELVNNPSQQAGFNPYLDQEKSVGGEVGLTMLRGTANGLYGEVVLFYIDVHDLLLPYQETEDGPTFFENAGNTRHIGLEWKLIWRPMELPLKLTGSYSLTEAEFIDFPSTDVENKNVPGVPDHIIDARAVWFPGAWIVSAELQWSDSYPTNNINSAQVDSYTDIQLSVRRSIPLMKGQFSISPFFQVQNLLNQNYSGSVTVNAFGGRFYEPALPRIWKAGVQFTWK